MALPELNKNIVPVILAGGSGSRLWPKSRRAFPKQLHCFYGRYTMLQHTVMRVNHLERPIVLCNERQRFMVAEQLREVCELQADIILEPVARNTAPAIVAAAHYARKKYRNPVLVILSADHLIKDVDLFRETLAQAILMARKDKIVTFGVVPTRPETGYGYIRVDAKQVKEKNGCSVLEFIEKPDEGKAQSYVQSGNYFWNSGMFVLRAEVVIEEVCGNNTYWLENCLMSVDLSERDRDFVCLNHEHFAACEYISIDFELLERTKSAWVIPFDSGWSDLGSWESVWLASDKDLDGNSVLGDTWIDNCSNSLIRSEHKLVVGIGLKNIAVIDTDDALLVIDLSHSQGVSSLVSWLEAHKRSEMAHHRQVIHSWGSCDIVAEGERHKISLMEVKPGAFLPAQMHCHRAEHWVVLRGAAEIVKGKEEFLLGENESIFIPAGEKYKVSNPGKLTLRLIDVPSGGCLGGADATGFETGNSDECSA